MTVTAFLTLVLGILATVFVFFRPMDVPALPEDEIAQLELKGFTLYELNPQGLKTTLSGSSGERYSDRYEATDISFTDSSTELKQTLVASYGVYRDNTVYLSGSVRYLRDDGVEFESEDAKFSQQTGTVTTEGAFTLTQNENRVSGERLVYESARGKYAAKAIDGYYILKEDGK